MFHICILIVVIINYLERDVVILGVDLRFLVQTFGVLRLQQVDANPIIEQPNSLATEMISQLI
jgi:hypothetical protein